MQRLPRLLLALSLVSLATPAELVAQDPPRPPGVGGGLIGIGGAGAAHMNARRRATRDATRGQRVERELAEAHAQALSWLAESAVDQQEQCGPLTGALWSSAVHGTGDSLTAGPYKVAAATGIRLVRAELGDEPALIGGALEAHAIACAALAEAYTAARSPLLMSSMQRAYGVLVTELGVEGRAWTARELAFTSLAVLAGLDAGREELEALLPILNAALEGLDESSPGATETAGRVLAQIVLARLQEEGPLSERRADELWETLMDAAPAAAPSSAPDELPYWYLGACAAAQLGEERWRDWRRRLYREFGEALEQGAPWGPAEQVEARQRATAWIALALQAQNESTLTSRW